MKWFLHNNNIEKYTTHNQGKSVVTGRFTRILKNKMCISKNVYIDKLDAINVTIHQVHLLTW